MPVKKNTQTGGYKWGNAGTVNKLTKEQAKAVERAAFANGYMGKGKSK
ncbi:MAG: hypothetical protein FWE23_08835 [Chitinivibrionia bacterium]|nr:hypothetical protein [Chitinivibrionia bacterium]